MLKFKIGIPTVVLIVAAFLIYPPLGFAVLALALFAIGCALLVYGGWLLIPYIPLLAFIWWSWDTIASWGFLGYWGVLGAILIPIILMFERLIDKNTEYLGTAIAIMIWASVAALGFSIEYWHIAKYIWTLMPIVVICMVYGEKSIKENENA